jgi:outer membrane receptor protein involved in Fe transport
LRQRGDIYPSSFFVKFLVLDKNFRIKSGNLNMRITMRIVYSLCIGLILLISNLFGQTTGKIAGEVLDKTNDEPLAGVNIILEGTHFGAVSSIDGSFYMLNIPPGTYTVIFQMIGYKTVKMEKVQVSVNRTAFVNAALEQTILEEEVIVVQADKVSMKKDQTGSMKTVSSEQMDVMPIENIDDVVSLQAGVVNDHFRGGRRHEVSYMVDGLQVDEVFGGEGTTVTIEADAVSEVEVITGNFNAEYGRAMSGVVNSVIKDGSPDFEASASAASATYLTSHNDVFPGLESIDPFRNQDYKFSISGPVLSNKILFFVNARYQDEKNHLNGIRRFKVNDFSDYSSDNENFWITEANGDGEYVPMNNNKNLSILTKLTFNIWNTLKTSLLYTRNDDEWNGYSHVFKYNPDGLGTTYRETDMYQLQLNHTLGQSAFYILNVSYIDNYNGYYLYENPLDSRYVHDGFLRSNAETGFYTGGQNKDHNKRTLKDLNFKFDLTWQLNRQHNIKTGVMGIQHWLDNKYQSIQNYYRFYPPPGINIDEFVVVDGKITYPYYKPIVLGDSSNYSDIYQVEPYEAAAYIQDKMEFMEMVVNLGLRMDYFDPNTVYPSDRRNPDNSISNQNQSSYPKTDPQMQISPRLSLAYQLGKTAVLRFSYGHFFQMPPLYAMYQDHAFNVAPTDYQTTMGNAQLKAEKTVQYEIGLWQELFEGMGFDVTLYYRDIYNLLSAVVISTYNQIEYGLYSNKDYGNTKGLELTANYNLGKWYANLNYTLQYTRGNADNPTQTFNRAGQTIDPVNKLIVMSWDQRHTFNTTLGYNQNNFGFSTILTYGSGSPYTWAPVSSNPLVDMNIPPNNDYTKSRFNVDLGMYYRFSLWDQTKLELELRVYNLFDRLNEYGVNPTTGRTAVAIVQQTDLESHRSNFNDYYDRIKDPSGYSAPRLVKLGLSVLY